MSVPPIRSKWQHGTDALVRRLTAEKDATLARIAELERENAELRRNDERYRSLRWMAMQDEETQERCKQAMEAVTPDDLTLLTDEMWDAAIDTIAALAKIKEA